MTLNWKTLRLAMLPTLFILGGGCAGVSTQQNVSPASFFIPGLIEIDHPAANRQVAQAN